MQSQMALTIYETEPQLCLWSKVMWSFVSFHSFRIYQVSVMPGPRIGSGDKPAASVHGSEVLSQGHSLTELYHASSFLC